MRTRTLGSTDLAVTQVALGTSPLGSSPAIYGYEVAADRARQTLRRAFTGPVTFLDTSNEYGEGRSETLIGEVLDSIGGLPAGFVVATKVDPDPRTHDFSGARVRASLAESLTRLHLDRVDLLHLHDPERISFEEATAPDGPVAALRSLRDEGAVRHLGVAGGSVDLLRRYAATGVFDVVLTHNRYTLLDRSAEPLIAEAAAAGMGVLNAAPFGGGILARGPGAAPRYAYRAATAEELARVRAIDRVCRDAGVPLAAAALHLSLRDPRIGSTVVGVSAPERVDRLVELTATEVPEELWDALAPHLGGTA